MSVLHEELCRYVSCSFILVMKFCTVVVQEAKTYFVVYVLFFPKIVALQHNYKKHDRAREAKEIIVV